ncbi:hypothetical protein EC968_009680 [Mortierella alpina]|nr:hypothetical protein EC968_009680 [Mortierella alpina]
MHNPQHVDRYDSVSPQAVDPATGVVSRQTTAPRYSRRIITGFSPMPANYVQTQGGTGFQVHYPQRRQGGQAARRAPAARVRRGSAAPAAQAPAAQAAPAAPRRRMNPITDLKHAMEDVFQTSALSVGSVKAQLRHVTGPAPPIGRGTGLSDSHRSVIAGTINNAVTALNNIRSYMLQAFPVYISTKLAGHTSNTAVDLAYRQQWLDPL